MGSTQEVVLAKNARGSLFLSLVCSSVSVFPTAAGSLGAAALSSTPRPGTFEWMLSMQPIPFLPAGSWDFEEAPRVSTLGYSAQGGSGPGWSAPVLAEVSSRASGASMGGVQNPGPGDLASAWLRASLVDLGQMIFSL